jgi:hypothetical protein
VNPNLLYNVTKTEWLNTNHTLKISLYDVVFEVLTMVLEKNSIFWDIIPSSLLKVNQNFRGTCPLYLQWAKRVYK